MQLKFATEEELQNVEVMTGNVPVMIRKELAKNPELADENWERFLP